MPLSVLLVDDDPVLRCRLEELAREAGFSVRTAQDGIEALEMVRTHPPDLLVTDVHMPRLQGPRLIELVRQMPVMEEAPVVVITADASRATKINLLQNGADDFILKPVDSDEFVARLQAHARRCDMTTELEQVRQERDAALKRLRERADELERLTFGLITALEQANTFNDEDTGNHIRRVAELSALLARAMGCSPEFSDSLRRYAGLHDVGKVGIPDAILKKPGRLTAEEFEEMKSHTLLGADLLRMANLPQVAINIPLCHHERWDGSGYPSGLRGEQIPLEARIVAVVDVYDALRSRRCYKPPFDYDKTTRLLREGSGNHFDPALVERFLSLREQIAEIEQRFRDESAVELSTPAEKVWA